MVTMADEQKNDVDAKDTTAEASAKKTTGKESKTDSPDKKSKKPRKTYYSSHPSFLDMLTETLTNLDDKDGSSFQAIKRYIVENFDVDENPHFHSMLKISIKKAVAKETITQTKGKGASGSFKLTNPVQTLLSKPTKRQQAFAEAAAEKAAKDQAAARRAAKRPKKKKHSSVAKSKAGSKAASRRPAPKKKSVKKSKPAAKPKAKSGRKGRR